MPAYQPHIMAPMKTVGDVTIRKFRLYMMHFSTKQSDHTAGLRQFYSSYLMLLAYGSL